MKFVAFERAKQGTGASRRLRITGKTPGIVYGGEGQPKLIELDHNALWHALKKEAFHSSILEMELAGQSSKVLLRDVQYHPFKQLVLHVDFQKVDATTKLHMKVPLHSVKSEESHAVKFEACVVNHVMAELDITCLPADLPEFIEVDLKDLELGHSLHVSDLKLPQGVEPMSKLKADNPSVVTIQVPKEVAVEEVVGAPVTEITGQTPEAAAAAAAGDKKDGDKKPAEKK
jgi:large subunit ribosomal protein L25